MEKDLKTLRQKVEQLDQELLKLLSQRMELSRQIAVIKKAESLPIEDLDREAALLKSHLERAKTLGLNEDWIRELFYSIFKESKRQQI